MQLVLDCMQTGGGVLKLKKKVILKQMVDEVSK